MSKENVKPTESEMEILQILWSKREASVREVHEELAKSKEAGYTTTLKLMQIMYEKGLVNRDASSKTHIYTARISRDQTEKQLVSKMISNIFNGSASRLVMQALGNRTASKQELDEIRAYLNELENKK
ncbi:transcriptional regulator [Pedobacter yulinensis]|uniref:Transcriptional regulator n=1 Tax=Pedobacter yulinensis TaxID=2126353 RepID=A0A2T3HHS0_9SPHI|nr:BlaI/MecI/CopY family transcriptional regulator [Pedobacter yulinensis]PST82006.1 transcriptional regulator [Pedobacter yulinensis]